MRTALTMLGIIIGVASVVALMAIGNGAKQDVLERIQAMGTDLLTIERGPPRPCAPRPKSSPVSCRKICPSSAVCGRRHGDSGNQSVFAAALRRPGLDGHGGRHRRRLPGGARLAAAVRRLSSRAEHVTRYAQVVAIGQTIAKNLFPTGTNPVGQYVLIGNAPFLVIAYLSSKGSTARGDDLDNSVWLPYTTAGARIFGQRFFQHIVVRVKPGADMGVVQAALHTLLIKRHRKEDFNIRNMADTIATANETQNTLTYLLAAMP